MPKRVLQGEVVSNKQAKTIVVRVERRFTHPVMKKTVRSSKKYYAHDEKGEYGVGDLVWIEEHRPISKLKRWTVVQGQKKATVSALSAPTYQWKNEAPDDSDADQPRRGGQFRRASRHVHQGAGRLEAQVRDHRRRHRGVGQGGDPARPRQEGRRDEGRGGAGGQGHPPRPTARSSGSTATRRC